MTSVSRAEIEDPLFWQSLVPDGTISENPFLGIGEEGFREVRNSEGYEISCSELNSAKSQLLSEGYFQSRPLLPVPECIALKRIVNAVVAAGLRPTYALMYDQFYHALGRLDPLLRKLLGQNYKIVPNEFEVFYVDHRKERAGTPPHRDEYGGGDTIMDDGQFKLINLWITLTDATPTNSCLYVVPAHLDDDFPERHRLSRARPANRSVSDFQNIRALPASVGSVIGWNPNLLHWGSRSSERAEQSRISFAVYFQRGDVENMHPTATPMFCSLPFEYRLYLVEKVWRDRAGEELSGYLKKYGC